MKYSKRLGQFGINPVLKSDKLRTKENDENKKENKEIKSDY